MLNGDSIMEAQGESARAAELAGLNHADSAQLALDAGKTFGSPRP